MGLDRLGIRGLIEAGKAKGKGERKRSPFFVLRLLALLGLRLLLFVGLRLEVGVVPPNREAGDRFPLLRIETISK